MTINKDNDASKPFLYLDVDGIILGKSRPDSTETVVAQGAATFLNVCLKYFNCYWLSTHCNDGDTKSLISMLRRYGDDKLVEAASKIRAAKWTTMKTEAIDFKSDFFWIDDAPLAYEIDELEKHDVDDRLVTFDTRVDPDALVYLTKIIIWGFETMKNCDKLKNIDIYGRGVK
jgi:hypothetical protein